jgi:hypothetical protein
MHANLSCRNGRNSQRGQHRLDFNTRAISNTRIIRVKMKSNFEMQYIFIIKFSKHFSPRSGFFLPNWLNALSLTFSTLVNCVPELPGFNFLQSFEKGAHHREKNLAWSLNYDGFISFIFCTENTPQISHEYHVQIFPKGWRNQTHHKEWLNNVVFA